MLRAHAVREVARERLRRRRGAHHVELRGAAERGGVAEARAEGAEEVEPQHRVGVTVHDIGRVMDGDVASIIEALQLADAEERLNG